MRAVFLTNLLPPHGHGGAELASQRHIELLRAAGHDVHVICTDGSAQLYCRSNPRLKPAHGTEERTEFTSFNFYHFATRPARRWSRPLWLFLDLFNPVHSRILLRHAQRVNPDIVIIANLWNVSTSAWRTLGRRHAVIQILHDGATICLSGFFWHRGRDCFGNRFPCVLVRRYRIFQSHPIGLVLAPSEFLLNTAARVGLFPKANFIRVPNPPPLASRARRTHHTDGRLSVGFIGAIHEYKGFRVFVEACAMTDVVESVHVAGQGSDQLIKWGSQVLGEKLRYDGQLPKHMVASWMEQLDVLVVPSLCHENSPGVIAEAQAVGVCVITTDSGGAAELVTTGLDGLVVQRNSPAAIAQAIDGLAHSPQLRVHLSVHALKRADARRQVPEMFVECVERHLRDLEPARIPMGGPRTFPWTGR